LLKGWLRVGNFGVGSHELGALAPSRILTATDTYIGRQGDILHTLQTRGDSLNRQQNAENVYLPIRRATKD